MEYYEGNLCVTHEELTEGEVPIIASGTLRQNVCRGNIRPVRRGGGEGAYALYEYSSLPDKYKKKYVEKYGHPEQALLRQKFVGSLVIDERAREFYEAFEYVSNGVQKRLTDKLIAEYTLNASVLNLLSESLTTKSRMTRQYTNARRDLWGILLNESELLRTEKGHTLPANIARLREKINRYKKEGYASLISGKVGNANTIKITEEAGNFIIGLKRCRVPVLTDAQIFAKYNAVCEDYGWKPLRSTRSLRLWLDAPEVKPLWYDAVFGELNAHQKFDRKHRTALPTRRDALWYGDGTKLNVYYRTEDGRVATTQVYEVMDAYSEVLLGYHISDTEDYRSQSAALRMALETAGHKPYEFVYDNQGGHEKLASNGFFSKIAVMHHPTTPYNGSSKTIESAFGRFQAQVLHKQFGYTGGNITAKSEKTRPNLEFIAANADKLLTLAELKEYYAAARREWNELPHPATGERRIDMYNNSVNDATPKLTQYDIIDAFWVQAARMSTFRQDGIEVTIDGRKYAFEVYASAGVPDMEWRAKNTYRRFVVKYDPTDLTRVRLYTQEADGSLRFEREAAPYMVVHRARQEQTAAEKAFIAATADAVQSARIARTVEGTSIAYQHGTAPEQQGMSTPKLRGIGSKAAQEEINKQLAARGHRAPLQVRRAKPAAELEIGRATKKESNRTYDQLSGQEFDLARAIGKL